MHVRLLLATAAFASLLGAQAAPLRASPGATGVLPYRDPALPVAERVEDLLGRMSLDDKVGQMALVDRSVVVDPAVVRTHRLGAVLSGGSSAPVPNTPTSWADTVDALQAEAQRTPLGIPLLYGVNAVHGHNGADGATVFPHQIGLGATRAPDLVERIGRATAEEMAGTGVDWNFAPCLCVARNDRWGRTYESFGEDPALVSSMASIVSGLQDGAPGVLATAKHYVGDGGTTGGVDGGDAAMGEAELRAVHLPPFRAAVERGVGSVMLSFSSWNGVPLHAHHHLVTDVLKGELGFEGFVVSDWAGIDRIDGRSGLSGEEVRAAVQAGVDMMMVPYDVGRFLDLLRAEVRAGRVPLARIDDANRRILTQKLRLGRFERPFADRSLLASVGHGEHRALAREAVARSQVVLRNAGGVLPLSPDVQRLFVAGRSADDIGRQAGGWTISWQGASGDVIPGDTILDGIRAGVAPGTTVDFDAGGRGVDAGHDAAVVVVGEAPYAEYRGDRPGAMGLDAEDLATLARVGAAAPDVPLVVVLVSGRPLEITDQLEGWDALVAAWLPGSEGGGVADVLLGATAPSGTLPVTWMRRATQQPINAGDGQVPLFPLGAGLVGWS